MMRVPDKVWLITKILKNKWHILSLNSKVVKFIESRYRVRMTFAFPFYNNF